MTKQIDLLSNREFSTNDEQTEQVRPPKLDISQIKTQSSKWSQYKLTGKNVLIRSYSAACAIDLVLYVYGGMQILEGILSDFHEIDINPKNDHYSWKEVEVKGNGPKPGPRAKHGMVAIGKMIYLFGGITGENQESNKIFSFEPKQAKWTELKPKGQAFPSIDSFGYASAGKKIYIACGYDSKKCQHLNSVLEYDIEQNTLTTLFENRPESNKLIPQPRSNPAAATDGSKLYLFGGKTEQLRLNDFWEFDFVSKVYHRVKDPQQNRPTERSGLTMNYYHGNLYIFGGIHEVTRQLDDLQIYNLKNNSWKLLEAGSATKKQNEAKAVEKESKVQKEQERKQSPKRKQSSTYYDTFMGSFVHRKDSSSPSPTGRLNIIQKTHQTSEGNAASPGKMIDEQRKKAFLAKKTQMLKTFDVPQQQKNKYLLVEPVTQAIKNSLDLIGNPNPRSQQPSPNKLTQFGKTTFSKFTAPLSNNTSIIHGKRPCARDGHNAVLVQNNIVFFGGDRHHMSFNDLYRLNMELVQKEIL